MTDIPKCDYCDQPATQLAGETNGVLVCNNHASNARADFGRLEAYVAEYVNDSPAALRVQVTEARYNALEMARKADLAERRAEEAEFHVEQLRDALNKAERRVERAERLIDSWEHDAPDHSNPVFIGRLRECLRRDPAPIRLRDPEPRGDA